MGSPRSLTESAAYGVTMFKLLKNNIKIIVVYTFVFVFIVWSSSFWFDDSYEQLDQLDQEVTALSDEIDKLGQSMDAYIESRGMLEDTLREVNELLDERLEQNKELFLLLEQRIGLLQDILNDADLNSTDLTTVLAEITDILQTIKDINETEAAVLAE